MESEVTMGGVRSTIRAEKRRREAGEASTSLLPRGRPTKLDAADREKLKNAINEKPTITNRALLAIIDNKVFLRTLQLALRTMGERRWCQRQRPLLTPEHARKRLEWARRHEDWTVNDWKRVCWTDEATIERGVGKKPKWTFNSPREQLQQHDVTTYTANKAVRRMVWGGFSYDRRTHLQELFGDPESARGGVSSKVIYALYSHCLPWLLSGGKIFMHDNARVHTAGIVKQLLERMEVEVMIWPPYSPDLNPIENLWALLKAEIYQRHPELKTAPDNETTLQRLVIAAKEAWLAISCDVHHALSDSMVRRVQAIIAAEGWYTKY